jgi:hypothetical protein
MRCNLLLLFTLSFQLVFSQTTENTVTLTTSGTGKTLEEAKNNALRSAIEQAFGAFISSKTEILNDEIVKDEVVTLSNGSIQRYVVLSEAKTSNDLFITSIKSDVSITNLTKYCVSKGVVVEFNGSLFSTNLKLQKLNEEAEFKAVLNLCETSKEILISAMDFNVEATEPVQIDANNDEYQIQYTVNCTTNNNYNIFKEYFSKTATGISMSLDEFKEYQKLKKNVYSFVIEGQTQIKSQDKKGNTIITKSTAIDTIRLRNIKSAVAFQNFFIRSNGVTLNFNIKNDIETIFINSCSSNCSDNRFKISESRYSHDLKTNKWILNFGGIDSYGNGLSGSVSFPDFVFFGQLESSTRRQKIKSSELFYCFVNEENMRKRYFGVQEDQKLFTTQTTIGYDPLLCRNIFYPTEFFDDYRIPYCFGVLRFDQNLNFKHSIKCNYTIEELSKITFIKVEQLKQSN